MGSLVKEIVASELWASLEALDRVGGVPDQLKLLRKDPNVAQNVANLLLDAEIEARLLLGENPETIGSADFVIVNRKLHRRHLAKILELRKQKLVSGAYLKRLHEIWGKDRYHQPLIVVENGALKAYYWRADGLKDVTSDVLVMGQLFARADCIFCLTSHPDATGEWTC